ncbi:MAG TPA: hypothetical protein VFL10_06760 [Ornithinibacter sp.]|nr:hypothetical protein [Ornithinibacter sp.]
MTDTAAPDGGWAEAPRPPLTVVLTEAQVGALTSEGVRATEHRPLVARLVVAVGLGVLIAVTFAPSAGVLTAVALIALAVGLFVVRRRMIEGSIAPGSARTTGYDRQGSFVLAGTELVVLARGSVAGVERRPAGVAVLRRRARRTGPVVLLDELVTPADETVLTTVVPVPD